MHAKSEKVNFNNETKAEIKKNAENCLSGHNTSGEHLSLKLWRLLLLRTYFSQVQNDLKRWFAFFCLGLNEAKESFQRGFVTWNK